MAVEHVSQSAAWRWLVHAPRRAALLVILLPSLALAEPPDEPGAASRPQSQPASQPAVEPAPPVEDMTPPPYASPKSISPPPARVARFFIGAGALAMVPVGNWRRHPYAGASAPSDLDQFGPGGGGRIEAGFQFWRFSTALGLELNSLDTGEWDRYATRQGTRVRSRALCLGLFYSLGGIITTAGPVAFDLHGAIGYAQAFGHERFEDLEIEYDYNFLKPTFSFRQGGAALLAISPRFDLAFGIDHTIGTYPVSYRDSPFWTLTFQLSFRFYPRGRPWR